MTSRLPSLDLTLSREAAGTAHIPQRRCVGCGRRAPQRELVRFALAQGRIVPDRERRLPGRGAWLCARAECLAHARRRGSLQRALRAPSAVLPENYTL